MSGLSGFGDNPGMRRLPRLAWAGREPGSVSVPRLPGRRSGAGSGRGVVRPAPCRLTARALSGRAAPALSCNAPRPAGRVFPAPPQGAMGGVQPHSIAGVQPATGYGPRPSGPGKAAASSRFALPLRRGSVVSTSEAGTDDAGNNASCKAAVRVWRDNGRTTGLSARCLPGGHGVSTRPCGTIGKSRLQPPRAAPTGAPGVFQSGRIGLCSRPFMTPADSQPRVRATNTYPSGRCEHA